MKKNLRMNPISRPEPESKIRMAVSINEKHKAQLNEDGDEKIGLNKPNTRHRRELSERKGED